MSEKIIYLKDLSTDLEEAVLREWYVQPEQSIQEGDPLLAFETAKTILEAPSPVSATVKDLHVQPGHTITTTCPILTVE